MRICCLKIFIIKILTLTDSYCLPQSNVYGSDLAANLKPIILEFIANTFHFFPLGQSDWTGWISALLGVRFQSFPFLVRNIWLCRYIWLCIFLELALRNNRKNVSIKVWVSLVKRHWNRTGQEKKLYKIMRRFQMSVRSWAIVWSESVHLGKKKRKWKNYKKQVKVS